MTVDEKYKYLILKVGKTLQSFDAEFEYNLQSGNYDIINHKLKIVGVITSQLNNSNTMLKTTYQCCLKIEKQFPTYTFYIFNVCDNVITFNTFNYIKIHKRVLLNKYSYVKTYSLNDFPEALEYQKKCLDEITVNKDRPYLKLMNILKKKYIKYDETSINNHILWDDLIFKSKTIFYKDKKVNTLKELMNLIQGV